MTELASMFYNLERIADVKLWVEFDWNNQCAYIFALINNQPLAIVLKGEETELALTDYFFEYEGFIPNEYYYEFFDGGDND